MVIYEVRKGIFPLGQLGKTWGGGEEGEQVGGISLLYSLGHGPLPKIP